MVVAANDRPAKFLLIESVKSTLSFDRVLLRITR